MGKTAVVYWSGTGNTEAMAEAVADGVRKTGAEVSLLTSAEFSSANVKDYDAIAFGCPAMGAEVLEETEFQPMWDEVSGHLSGKKIALFGSWGWGGGAWMQEWEADCIAKGIVLAAESVICADYPDDTALSECKNLGKAIS